MGIHLIKLLSYPHGARQNVHGGGQFTVRQTLKYNRYSLCTRPMRTVLIDSKEQFSVTVTYRSGGPSKIFRGTNVDNMTFVPLLNQSNKIALKRLALIAEQSDFIAAVKLRPATLHRFYLFQLSPLINNSKLQIV
jgi:hypothetical protein